MSHNLRRKATGVLAGLTVAALMMGGTTTALWNDYLDLRGEDTITSGNLDVEALTKDTIWTDVSDNKNIKIDPNTFKIIPGDTVTGTKDMDVALEGDNLMTVFDPVTGTMSAVATSPTNHYNPSIEYDPINKKILIMGGAVGMNTVKTIEVFDPATNKFTNTTGTMFTNRGNFRSFYSPVKNMIYAIGGWTGGSGTTNTIEAISLQ